MYSLHYYDLVLVGIAASLTAGLAVGMVSGIPVTVSVPAFAVIALGLLIHALFVNGPVESPGDLVEEIDAFE